MIHSESRARKKLGGGVVVRTAGHTFSPIQYGSSFLRATMCRSRFHNHQHQPCHPSTLVRILRTDGGASERCLGNGARACATSLFGSTSGLKLWAVAANRLQQLAVRAATPSRVRVCGVLQHPTSRSPRHRLRLERARGHMRREETA